VGRKDSWAQRHPTLVLEQKISATGRNGAASMCYIEGCGGGERYITYGEQLKAEAAVSIQGWRQLGIVISVWATVGPRRDSTAKEANAK
jgi:hypothetical protein